ncbi:MAG: hypothetical protein AAGE52_14555 [Myxococcota bacterium]
MTPWEKDTSRAARERIFGGMIWIALILLSVPAGLWAIQWLPRFEAGIEIAVSTAFWSGLLIRAVLRKGLRAILWRAPFFGWLNVLTALALHLASTHARAGALVLGAIYGLPIGIVLGVGFGALVAFPLGYLLRARGRQPWDATINVALVCGVWLTVVAALGAAFASDISCGYMGCDEVSAEAWIATRGLLVLASAAMVTAILLHVRTLRWHQRVKEGRHLDYAVVSPGENALALLPLVEDRDPSLLVRRASVGMGPFREGDTRSAIAYVARYEFLLARTSLAAMAGVTATALWWI